MEEAAMNKQVITIMGAGAVIIAMASGCQSAKPEPPQEPQITEVVFPADEKPGPIFRIKDRNNPREVIAFARSLSAAGRYEDSAKIYLDASKRYKSVTGNFEHDCQKAAVREYWLAGEFDKAHKLLDHLEKEQDIYSKAEESKSLRRLRQLLRDSEELKRTSGSNA